MIDLIPTGEENAVLLKDLAVMVGKSPRTVQADVKRLRDRGYLILSSASGGYYFPSADKKGEAEAEQYIAMMESQAFGRLKRLMSAKKWLRERGQMQIDLEKEA
jgi:biotin operon repressor